MKICAIDAGLPNWAHGAEVIFRQRHSADKVLPCSEVRGPRNLGSELGKTTKAITEMAVVMWPIAAVGPAFTRPFFP